MKRVWPIIVGILGAGAFVVAVIVLFYLFGPARYVKGVSALCEGYESEAGPFHIVEHAEVFHPVFQGHYLGAYPTAQHAADDLAQGRTINVPGVEDAASLGIPPDLGQWQSPHG